MSVVSVEKLQAGYDGKLVLQEVDLQAEKEEITAILGASGCGKTTLLKNIIGLLPPWSGSIKIFGMETTGMEEPQFNQIRQKMGVLFQNGALLNSLSAAENIAVPLEQHTDMQFQLINRLVNMKLDLVGLRHAADLLPSELSGGMKKRVALARAIALDPDLLFCDEPSAGLDPHIAANLDRLICSLRDRLGMSIVVISHSVPSVERISDKIIFMEAGQVVFVGTVKEAKSSGLESVEIFFKEGKGVV
ncbi:MAG: ATP-binding cassette domain-containing protein [bacterium]